MKRDLPNQERVIAILLWYGTWLACFLIAAGMLLSAASPVDGHDVMRIGIGAFILLPIIRVVLMLVFFLRTRDYPHTTAATLVLAIIAAGVVTQL